MIFVDSHSHIYMPEFDGDRDQMLANAAGVGVKYHVLPNVDSQTTGSLLETASKYPEVCFPLIGLHPTSVKADFEKELEHVEEVLGKHKFYGIGEIGIDLYWDKTFLEQQKVAFRHQLKLAKKNNLPAIIHARNSFDEIFSIVDEENDTNLRGVFHSFTGTLEQYQHIVSYGGFKVGIGGVVTYKHGGVDKVVPRMDISNILLETDAPWLSPIPKRGQRNESQNIIYTAQKIAELLGISVEDVAKETTQNAKKLFNIKVD